MRGICSAARRGIALSAIWVLSACGNLIELPGQGPAPQIYTLTAPANMAADFEQQSWRLLVEQPGAARAIDTDRIAIKPSSVEVSYLKGATWSDRAPRMMQSLLVESFDNSNAFELVARTSTGLNAQYRLTGNLIDFHAEVGGADSVHVKLKMSLVERRSAKIVSSQVFDQRASFGAASSRSIVLAFEEATTTILQDVVSWSLSEIDAVQMPADVPGDS